LIVLTWACAVPPATPTATPVPPTATTTPLPTSTPLPPISVQPVEGMPSGTGGYPWWNDTVFYEVFVRSFYDSDGDGIGDLNGLIAKLDYLNDGDPNTTTDLGVTGLWLMPIHPAASYHGYDVINYYAVSPDYGTLDDFKRLLAEAHRRGLRVLIDWVPNHTSNQHPWFRDALNSQSEYHDWYVWADKAAGSGWHPTQPSGHYYYGYFGDGMPDLDYTNPAVTEQMRDVVRYWLEDVGVDGFRIDAIKYLIEEGGRSEHTPATHMWLKEFHPFYKAINPEALMLGEIWDRSGLVADYTKGGDELDLGFNFDMARAILWAAAYRRNTLFNETLKKDLAVFPPNQFATFITNHDQDRVMSVLGGDVARAKAAATLLLASPGVPFIYYGEEIGMLGRKPDQSIRVPMAWSAEANGGFTTASFPWIGVNLDYETKNVAAQTDDPASLLSFYRDLIRLRSQHAALRVGETFVPETGNLAVAAVLRVTKDEAVLTVVNLGKDPVNDYGLALTASPLRGDYQPASLLGPGPFAPLPADASGAFANYQPLPTLTPYDTVILQLQPRP
jgi:glycosidase